MKVEKATQKTSIPKNYSDLKAFNRGGFTLIEVMIVLGILGFVLAFGLPALRKPQNNIRQVSRQLASLSREVRNQARMKKMTHRIVFRLGDKGAYWVEYAPGNVLIPSEATLEKMKRLDQEDRPKDPFQKATRLIKDEKELPNQLVFGSVETPNGKGPVTDGTAYVYYSPEGLVERAVIQVTNKKQLTWTLILNPITGHADIVEKAISLKDLKFE
ncbi:MAG: Tfp pilus assembly protein FimT/FimU [Pseudobdellovibrionaceae bacterium]